MGTQISIHNDSLVPVSFYFYYNNYTKPAHRTPVIPPLQKIKLSNLSKCEYHTRAFLHITNSLTITEFQKLSESTKEIVKRHSILNRVQEYVVDKHNDLKGRTRNSGYYTNDENFMVVIETSSRTMVNFSKDSEIRVFGHFSPEEKCYFVDWTSEKSVRDHKARSPSSSFQSEFSAPRFHSIQSDNEFVEMIPPEIYKKSDFIGWSAITSNVYKCVWTTWHIDVAVKFLPSSQAQEIEVLRSLQHKNVVLYYGVVFDSPNYFLVMEYTSVGSVEDYLKRISLVTVELQLHWAKNIADGMTYLHYECPNHPIIHRDLKPSNVLLFGDDLTAKVSDFGCSKPFSHTTEMSSYILTIMYAAPEVINREPINLTSDVFSYGATMYQICTLEKPYQDWTEKQEYVRQNRNVNCPDSVTNPVLRCIIENCFVVQTQRPSFLEIQIVLRTKDVNYIHQH